MSHPILPYMPVVFIPVKDLKLSIEWYSELLELLVQPKQDGGGIYYFDLDDTDIILDSNIWGAPPMIMFDTNNIDAAHDFCINEQYPVISELQRFPNVAFFNVYGNMICHAARSPQTSKPKAAHPLLQRVCRVFAHADYQAETEQWYERFLQRSAEPDRSIEGGIAIRMERGADLLIDDNRLANTDKVHFDRLQLDLRVNPILMIETPNIKRSLEYVKSKGAVVKGDIESRFGLTYFTFYDPDGNGLMVCQSE